MSKSTTFFPGLDLPYIILRMLDLKERTRGAIQRDRLSEFIRVAGIHDTGCFYFALLMSWNYLFPDKIIGREFAYDVTNGKDRLIVSPQNVISEIKSREEHLQMRVARVGITEYLDESIEDFRENVKIPEEVKVDREIYPATWENPNTALILWMSTCRLHYTSPHPNNRFAPEETAPYHPEYAPIALFHLERSI